VLASTASLWFFYSRNEILLSGDAVAHINIARRVFDSRTPGLLQLGSVWLPLPHLLTIPFVVDGRLWQSGLGGSVISALAYIFAGIGLFRLLSRFSRMAAWVGALFFAANPNLLYVQSTALNEPLYLATFVWAALFFVEAHDLLSTDALTAGRRLQRGSIVLAAAVLTRYDGWFLASTCWLAIAPGIISTIKENRDGRFRADLAKALLLTALAPTLWLAYNYGVYSNELEFANGPYSAKAIAQRTIQRGFPPYPGEDHPVIAGIYFVKAAQLNIDDGRIAKLVVLIAAAGSAILLFRGAWLAITILWSPLLFYALSIAYGSVPIFIPVWWPFSYYNARYGLELLPAIAAGMGCAVYWIEGRGSKRTAIVVVAVLAVLPAIAYLQALRQIPICLRETQVNGNARLELDQKLAAVLSSLPDGSTVLAYTAAHSGAFEMAKFRLRQTINEGNFYIWDAALAHPETSVDYVIASEGDPVWESVSRRLGLVPIVQLRVEGQPRIVVYRTSRQRVSPAE
jgi:uncharacterized protein YheU (UPF0270 family)